VRLAVAGSTGRMGRMVIEAALEAAGVTLAAALEGPGHPLLGTDCGAFLGRNTGVSISSDLAALAGCDALIDFTRPAGTLTHLAACEAHGVAMVVGTTGFDADGRDRLQAAATRIPLLVAPNLSAGVQVLARLVALAAGMLGDDYDLEIVEMHHRDKVDAPSGTALMLGEVAAQARGQRLDDVAVLSREGHTGARQRGAIGFATLRGGDVVGDHSVVLAGAGERIEITHRSGSRRAYAVGALRGARFLCGRAPGWYTLKDVMGA
jgi:4-hydroxy-tetrahydrodipicolinate reductase